MPSQPQLSLVNFRKASYIIVEGKQQADHFYIIHSGHVKISKQDRTLEVLKIMEEIKEAIRKLEGYMRFQFSKKSEAYQRVFPKGLSEFCLLNKSNIEALMSRVLVFVKSNSNLLDVKISREIEHLYNDA